MKLHIATSPLTNTIFCGQIKEGQNQWGSQKEDLTIEALIAVAEHVHKFGKPVEISKESGELEYRITVEKF